MSLARNQAKRITQKILSEASFGDVRVRIRSKAGGHTRFANSQPTTEGDIEELDIAVTASRDGRHATVTGNRTDDKSLAELVQQAEALAELAPVDPEHMPALGKTSYPRVRAVDPKVARMGPAQRAEIVGDAIRSGSAALGKDKGGEISGFLEHEETSTTVADRAGLFGHHVGTELSLGVTARTADESGSAKRGFVSHARAGLDAEALATEAAHWAERSRDPKGIDPGRYTVLLMPDAVADILSFFLGALDARRAAEGRSFFSAPGGGTRIGQKLFADRARLFSDPTNADHPASPIARDGRPHAKVTWIEGGELKALEASRYWASKAGVPSIPRPNTLLMAGGSDGFDALVGGIDRGILVTRFWYNRMLEPRTITATGLTRDGTFLIEKGKIAHPIKNMRYNDSPVTVLRKMVALGRPQRAGLSTRRVMVVPPIVVEGFNFESSSDAI